MDELTADVVVAGAGPTGLMLANELALAGVDVVVLERLAARTRLSKALNLQPRTAEVLDLRGLLGRAEQRSFTTVPEGHFAMIPVSYANWDTRHPYQVGIPQAQVEAALEERLAEQGVKVLRGHELTGFAQDATGVTVTAGDVRVRATYLVGCDGGRSAVRKALNLPFEGIEGRGHGVSADVLFASAPPGAPTEWRSMRNLVRSATSPGSFVGLIPLAEPNLYRLSYGDRLNRPADLRAKVTDDEVRAKVRESFGDAVEISEIRWASRFSDDSRLAGKYRVDRVFLAGDAAHTHFPAGGQGLNLGVQDAVNLGWKLAAELNGRAPAGLLDTYEAERRPVAEAVLQNVAAQTALIPATPEQRAMRLLFQDLTAIPEVQHRLSGMVSGLNIRYASDEPHPAGTRLPDFPFGDGYVSDLFHKGKFVLLTTTPARPPHPDVVVARVPTLPWPDLTRVLVRPDGYVATATDSVDGWLV
ncbi:FAD-dependent monooxygenase [Amycolatopsis sp. SID8362]|uniref:FAD-dependent monooxygenase n=1 Tax=Amycolatopsis sp. SID8362 TaxID=2690346 RepID=UPI00136FD448|nr:FAD-dependent monooxygenase [Amycolatopsis sp. SID8362]NBH06649.1 FAD-dependent oxidoreductase [Amycolatopsis sp. SID8362]NED43346.1 FAD-dependent oxidoreductase [Amycolatopsis sp. SID8362]